MKAIITIVLIWALSIFGEIRCIYQFFTSDFESSYKREVVYGVAAVTGLGAIVGYINIHDTPQEEKEKEKQKEETKSK